MKPGNLKELRRFGLTFGALFAVFGAYSFFMRHHLVIALFVLSAVSVLFAALEPKVLQKPFAIWTKLVKILGWIKTRVLLSLMYFLIVTPMAILGRLMGRKVIALSFDKKLTTYRSPVDSNAVSSMNDLY